MCDCVIRVEKLQLRVSDVQKQRQEHFSLLLSFTFHHPFSVVSQRERGGSLCMGQKESNLKGVEILEMGK